MTLLSTVLLVGAAADPPLDPSGDEARDLLRRELARPEYHDTDILQRIFDWITQRIGDGVGGAQNAPTLSTAIAVLVALLLIAAIMLAVSRARLNARDTTAAPALTDETITAAELRARAEAALAAGDNSTALVDGFRALAVRQVERGAIDDIPQATAHELARSLAARFAEQADAVHAAADLFDLTLYGERTATVEQARKMLHLDDVLAGRLVAR